MIPIRMGPGSQAARDVGYWTADGIAALASPGADVPAAGAGSAAGAALAWASTYALGRAFCEYFQQVHQGHLPPADALKKLYHAQFTAAERAWFHSK